MNHEEYPLLPSDRYLAQMLGISDEEYADFKAEARKRRREGPSPLVVNEPISTTLAIISIVASVISIGLTIIASFFKPKPGRPAQLKANDKSQDAINAVERYAPRVGFDAAQDIARIGQTIPLVFAKREVINAGTENEETVGGVRITCPLIWSQIKSYGGNQLLRAMFLLSEGQITSIDTTNFAIGSNVIGAYLLISDPNNTGASMDSRLSIYFKKGGGTSRLNSTHLIAGRAPSNDTEDKSRDPGAESIGDIFTVEGATDFCSVSKPTTQTTFGLYAPIGNNLGFRVNPVFRPAVNAQLVPKGDEGDAKVKCDRDVVSLSQRKKYKAIFSTRSGLISGNVGSIGSECEYKLFKSSDKETDFSVAFSAGEWEPSVSVNDADYFLWGAGLGDTNITNQQIRDLLSISNKTVDSQQKTITVTATFNITAAAALFDAATKPGTYDLKYKVEFVNDNGDDEVSLEKDWVIQVKVEQETNYYWQDNSTASDAEWSYDPATETLTKVSGGSINVDGDIVIDIANTNITLTFDGGSEATSNLTTGLMTRTLTANYADEGFHQELAGDVASTISSKQRGWDDSIIQGELYKVGSAICVCSSRTDDVFQSSAEFDDTQGGKEVEATFRTIRPGETAIYTPELLERSGKEDVAAGERKTGTNGPHIHRIALGEVSTSRACEKVEIGLKSVLGIRVGGLCNFKDTLSFDQVDQKACKSKQGKTVSKGETLKVDVYQSGVISCSVERFSFFRISYREAGTTGPFIELDANFGVRGITQQNQFNGILFNMGVSKRWTFRFEPLSGWEIRNQKWSGPLYILDAKLAGTVTVGIATFRGQKIWGPGDGSYTERNSDFWISISRRNNDLGLGHLDDGNFVDGWGKLAEQFIYEEVSASTQGPEHEIVYINEIVPNATTPLYDNLAIIGLNIRSSAEWQQFSQFSCYVTGGIDNTHLFPEILKKLLLDKRYGVGHAISASQIDDASFTAATAWCAARGYYFDGVISERQNIRQWAADVAATMLLIFGEANGKFFLRPAVPFDAVQIKGLFTADNVLEGTYQMQYLDLEDRLPIQVSIKYREERESSNITSPGIFPTERELLIREAGVAETEKIEQIDVSDYVTRRGHAIDVAKFVIRMRRLPTHGIKFQTTYDGLTANLAPGDYIRCAIDSTYYDDFNNGVVSATGSLTSTQALTDGTYQVFAWDGSTGSKPSEVALTVSGGGTTASPTGVIFSVQNVVTSIRTYQIESLGIEENGAITIEAVHMPTDQMTANWDSETAWDIQE